VSVRLLDAIPHSDIRLSISYNTNAIEGFMRKHFPLGLSEILSLVGIASLTFTIINALTGKATIAIAVALSLLLSVIIFWSISRIYTSQETRYKLKYVQFGKEVREANKCIKKSEETIWVTHFTASYPSELYTSLMIEKMDQGVSVVRVVGEEIQKDSRTIDWLKKFRPNERYSEYISRREKMPFDFTIFDEQKVIIYFPLHPQSREFNKALILNNAKVASIFRGLFDRLTGNSDLHWLGGQCINHVIGDTPEVIDSKK
jgi:hypothetical protein